MDSSTSHSNGWFPRKAFALLLTALVAWVLFGLYSLHLNPEVVHYSEGAKIKNAWAEKMTREYGAKVIVIGGSSCEFSIDGERMLKEFHLPTVNYGRHAGMGPSIMVESVLGHLRHGDTLIIAVEPGLLTEPLSEPSLAVQFSVARHHPEWVLHPTLGVGRVSLFQAATLLRPGGYHVFTMLGKIVLGEPLYRYKLSDYRASGWKQTDVRMPIGGPPGHGQHLSQDALLLLQRLHDWCDQHGVRAAYSLPWAYTPEDKVREFQKENIQFLLQVAKFFPVLKDSRLGADPNKEDFADTNFHLRTAAAETRTDELAKQIVSWNVWTVEELKAQEQTL